MNARRNKKASYFFLFDAVIAAMVFFGAIALISSSISEPKDVNLPTVFSESLLNYYYKTQITEVDNSYIDSMYATGYLKTPRNTLLEQMLVLYERNAFDPHSGIVLREFIINITNAKLPVSYGYNITITDNGNQKSIYSRDSITSSKEVLTTTRKLGLATLDNNSIYGPVIFSVSVWY